MDIKKYRNPSMQYRSSPFWSWNGEMEEERLKRQISAFKEGGMGGIFMHSRPGLKTEYLGEQWFKCVSACVEHSREIGMEAHLYDEDKYSSGTVGGELVRRNPEFELKQLVVSTVIEPEGSLVATFSVGFEDGAIIDYKRINEEDEVEEGKQKLYFQTLRHTRNNGWYNYSSSTDLCNPDVIDSFLESTHDKYYEREKADFGTTIPSMFTDEVSIGWLAVGGDSENIIAKHQWSLGVENKFKERYGYNFIDYLPELFFGEIKGSKYNVSLDYIKFVTELFEKNFSQKIATWCGDRNIALTGHLHFATFSDFAEIGNPMKHFYYWQWPGMDILTDAVAKLSAFKMTASAVHQYGKERCACETYGCTGWDWPLERHKFHAGWQFCLGVNFRNLHLSHYTLAGWGKKDYPASISPHSPWFKCYNLIEDRCARISYLLSEGAYAAKVLVVSPINTVYELYHGMHKGGKYDRWSKTLSAYNDIWESITENLIKGHIDFDFGDEEMTCKLGRAENGEIVIGDMHYDTVVIPPIIKLDENMAKLIEESGVKVFDFNKENGEIDEKINKLLDFVPKNVSITENSIEDSKTWSIVRDVENGQLLFIQSMEKREKTVRIRTKDLGDLVSFDVQTGKIYPVDAVKEDGYIIFDVDLTETDNKLFGCGIDCQCDALPEKTEQTLKVENLMFEYRLAEPNALPLDYCRFSIDGGEMSEYVSVSEMEDRILRHYNLPSKVFYESCQPWYSHKELYKKCGKIKAEFVFELQTDSNGICLAMENTGSIKAFVNGKEIGEPIGFFIDEDIKTYDISKVAFLGKNTVTLEVDYDTDTELENMYIIGDFSVEMSDLSKPISPSNVVISKMRNKISGGPLSANGLPFYTGSVFYKTSVVCKEDGKLLLDGINCVACGVSIAGKSQYKAFGPFVFDIPKGENEIEIELICGRKNIMGPLHVTRAGIVEPDDFRFDSPHWKYEYQINDFHLI